MIEAAGNFGIAGSLIDRRRCLAGLALLGAAPLLSAAEPSGRKLRAAVIGHTGRGNYGHGLDSVWLGHAGIELVAVADPDETGRMAVIARLQAAAVKIGPAPEIRGYADYREMLAAEKPDLVSVATRHSDQHAEMLEAAIAAGAHIYSEKPYVSSMDEADRVAAALRAQTRVKVKIAVAHQMPYSPGFGRLVEEFRKEDAGEFGHLVEMRAWGKQDQRAGGEDLMVLGCHLFDLMRRIGGDPAWCFGSVTTGGRPVTKEDRRLTKDNVGYLAGDSVKALFGFPGGVMGSFTSRADLEAESGSWGVEVVGSKATARILANIPPTIAWTRPVPWTKENREIKWESWPGVAPREGDPPFTTPGGGNVRVRDDLLEAIRADRPPLVSGEDGAKAVEMIQAVHASALSGERVTLPLAVRSHPYAG